MMKTSTMQVNKPIIRADIRYSGVLIGRDAAIPLLRSTTRPDAYDIHRSLRALAILDRYNINQVMFSYSSGGVGELALERSRDYRQSVPFSQGIGANLLSERDVATLMTGRVKLVFSLIGASGYISDKERERCAELEKRGLPCRPQILQCALCAKESVWADTHRQLTFCSQECFSASI